MMRLSISFIHMRHSDSVSQRIHHDSNLSLQKHSNGEQADRGGEATDNQQQEARKATPTQRPSRSKDRDALLQCD